MNQFSTKWILKYIMWQQLNKMKFFYEINTLKTQISKRDINILHSALVICMRKIWYVLNLFLKNPESKSTLFKFIKFLQLELFYDDHEIIFKAFFNQIFY